MSHRRTTVLLTILIATSVTACGSSEDPRPTPTSAAQSTTRAFPPRPKDISLKDVDPCQLLTDQQLEQLTYGRNRLPDKGSRLGEAQCSVGNDFGPMPRLGSLISLVVSEDITAWLTPERQSGLEGSQRISIAGYPALEITGKATKDDCQVVVDVADGQYLDILSAPNRGRGTSPEPYCVEAKRVAEMVMTTLLAKR
ncbi:DUF3558 domain-containing protein [Allokutzneria sp. NRRL B-24872]|uniref:DUF3558 domain-containing protein n=1 Tax=Allokutzneria sp. NRRL B-24872 TaxID=1137961 RepID=UPI000A38609F|nr:DUF3558 domain-containing protein [Allokutzneria sp. NRRL B-24872]